MPTKIKTMATLTKTAYNAYLIYREYCTENDLDYDGDELSVEETIKFVNEQISQEDRERIQEFINEAY